MAFDPIAAGTEFGTAMALESILMIREYLGYRKRGVDRSWGIWESFLDQVPVVFDI